MAIELSLPRGVYASEVIEKLYHYTNCQISISVNLLLLSERYPVVYTIKDLIKFHAAHLQKILKMELELQKARFLKKYFIKHSSKFLLKKDL